MMAPVKSFTQTGLSPSITYRTPVPLLALQQNAPSFTTVLPIGIPVKNITQTTPPPNIILSPPLTIIGSVQNAFATNAAVQPAIPTGTTAGDLVIAICYYRSPGGAVSTSAGWTHHNTIIGTSSKAYIFSKFFQAGDNGPIFTPLGGGGSDSIIGLTIAFRGAGTPRDFGPNGINSSQKDIPVPATSTSVDKGAVIVFGGRTAGYSSIATLTGDGLNWVEDTDISHGTLGFLVGLQHTMFSGGVTLTDKTMVIGAFTGSSVSKMFIVPVALINSTPKLNIVQTTTHPNIEFQSTTPIQAITQTTYVPKLARRYQLPLLVQQYNSTTLQVENNIQVAVRNTIQSTLPPALGKTCHVLPIVFSLKQIQPTLNVKAEKLTTQLQLLSPGLGGGLTLQFSVSLPYPTVFYGGVQIDKLQIVQTLPEGRFAHDPIVIPRLSLHQTTYLPEYRLLDQTASTSWRIKQKRKARRRRHYERQSMMIAFRMDPKAVTVKQLFRIPEVAVEQVNLQPQTIRENAGLSIVQYNHAPSTILNANIEVFSVIQSGEAPSLSSFSISIPVLSIIETLSAPTIGVNNKNIDKLVFTQRGIAPAVAAPIIRVIQNNINPALASKYSTPTVAYTQSNGHTSLVLKSNSPKLSFAQSNRDVTVTLKYNSATRQIVQTLPAPDTLFRIRLNVPVYQSVQAMAAPKLTKLYGIPYVSYNQTNSAPRLVRRYPIPSLFFTFEGLEPSIQTIPPEYAVKSLAEDRVIYYFTEDRVIIGYLGDRTITALEEIRNVERV